LQVSENNGEKDLIVLFWKTQLLMDLLLYLKEKEIPFEENIPLSKKTWIKTGGFCAYWITPRTIEELSALCKYLYANDISFDLVGQTSNIFFHSTYHPKVVVSTVKVNSYNLSGGVVICDCGVNVMRLAKELMAEGYVGFYGLVGLPGTVASAAVNNAGCFDCSISSMLLSADVLMPDGTVQTIHKEDFGYEKRSSKFKRGEMKGIVLSVKLKLQKADNVEEEYKKSEETKLYRKTKQEGPKQNLGSVFAVLKRKRNVKNELALLLSKVADLCHILPQKRAYKKALLTLYGYTDLNNYISDKQLNTFVWRDEEAEQKFVRYKEFMGKVFKDLTIEIEERQ
jgi:UDP-N-acetylmuramate dehydrogenase